MTTFPNGHLHFCENSSECRMAWTRCYEDLDGVLWVDNGEYQAHVRFCPECGQKATLAQVGPRAAEEFIAWKLTEACYMEDPDDKRVFVEARGQQVHIWGVCPHQARNEQKGWRRPPHECYGVLVRNKKELTRIFGAGLKLVFHKGPRLKDSKVLDYE